MSTTSFSIQWNGAALHELESRIDDLGAACNAAVAEIAEEVFWRVDARTPVLTGAARGNWRIGINKVDGRVDPKDVDPTGLDRRAEAHEILRNVKVGDVVYITNGLPYINRLEHGWSKKAPSGMIGVTMAELPFIVAKAGEGLAGKLHGGAGGAASDVIGVLGGGAA